MNKLIEHLTSGAINKIITLDSAYEDTPIIQILSMKSSSDKNNPRVLLCLSDGEHFYRNCLAPVTVRDIFEKEMINAFSVIKIEKLQIYPIKSKKFIFISKVTAVSDGNKVNSAIGNPQEYVVPNALITVPSKLPEKPVGEVGIVKSFPIESVSIYQPRWPLKVRITYKSDRFKTKDGKGEFFKVIMADSTGRIEGEAFHSACETFSNVLKINKVYYIYHAVVRLSNSWYSKVKHDCVLKFTDKTVVKPCEDNEGDMVEIKYEFVPISQLKDIEVDKTLDVIGVVNSGSDIVTVQTKNNKESFKRILGLVDDTNNEISLSLWGNITKELDVNSHPVIVLQGVKLSKFGITRSLSITASTTIEINPALNKANQLRCWYDNGGKSSLFYKITTLPRNKNIENAPFKTISEVYSENLGSSCDYGDFVKVKAMVISMKKENALYKSCTKENCNKKLVDKEDGRLFCEKCKNEAENYQWRLLLPICIADSSSHIDALCFNDKAEILLGQLSSNIADLKESDPEEYENVFANSRFKSYIFGICVKKDKFNERCIKGTVVEVWEINYEAQSDRLKEEIKRMSEKISS